MTTRKQNMLNFLRQSAGSTIDQNNKEGRLAMDFQEEEKCSLSSL